MLTKRKAFFRFEALPEIGAGHAIRTSVIVDVLRNDGWECIIISSKDTFDFVPNLKRFRRVNPLDFYNKPQKCDLMVFDGYDFDETYEKYQLYNKKNPPEKIMQQDQKNTSIALRRGLFIHFRF